LSVSRLFRKRIVAWEWVNCVVFCKGMAAYRREIENGVCSRGTDWYA
jgi:hypothetical protein